MDRWTALVTTQKSLRTETLQQYYELEAMNRCAIAFGMPPVQGVTLHTDVLGQLVFSALDRTVAGSRSAHVRRRQTEEMLHKLESTARIANKWGDRLSDDSLSWGDTLDKLIDDVGGKKELKKKAVDFLLLGGGAAGVYETLTRGKNYVQGTTPTDSHIYDKFNSNQTLKKLGPPVDRKSEAIVPKFDELVAKYEDMKNQQDEAVKFIAEHAISTEDLYKTLIKSELTPEDIKGIDNNPEDDYFGTSKEVVKNNKLLRALLIWIETTLRGFKKILDLPNHDGAEPALEELDARIQGSLPTVDIPKANFKLKMSKTSDVCNQYMEIYRRDSLATRFLVQEMLKKVGTKQGAN